MLKQTEQNQLTRLKTSFNAKLISKQFVKVTHKYQSFEIIDYLDEDSLLINQTLKIYTQRIRQPSNELKELINDLILLDKELDK